MAIIATTQVLHDGARNVVVQLNGHNDGGSGGDNEKNVVKVSASELTPPPGRQLKVRKVTYDVQGGTVVLSWGGDEPVPFLHASQPGEVDHSLTGGIGNPNAGDNTVSGDIVLSTKGFGAGSSYSIRLEMVKS